MRVIDNRGLVYDSNDYLAHHGILGQRWGKMQGPPYPLGASEHTAAEKKAGWRKSLGGGRYSKSTVTKTSKRDLNYKLNNNSKPGKLNSSEQKILDKIHKADKQNAKDHAYHDKVVEEAKRTGKSAAEIERRDRLKKAVAIGAIIVGTAIVGYGSYKLYNKLNLEKGKSIAESTFSSESISLGSNKYTSINNADSDFLSKSFSGRDYIAMDTSPESKKMIDSMLTMPTGDWWNGLSESEKKAIESYTGKQYEAINDVLWKAKGGSLGFSHADRLAKSAQSALDKASLPESMVVTHGLTMDKACSFLGCSKEELIDAAKGGMSYEKLIGKVNTNYGLVSAETSSSNIAGYFGGVKCKILLPKGAKAAYAEHISLNGDLRHPPYWDGHSSGYMHSREFETLIKAGSKFKTKGIQYDNSRGFIEVALEYVSEKTNTVPKPSIGSINYGTAMAFKSMRSAGMTFEAISKKMGIPISTIEYYINLYNDQ